MSILPEVTVDFTLSSVRSVIDALEQTEERLALLGVSNAGYTYVPSVAISPGETLLTEDGGSTVLSWQADVKVRLRPR